MFRYLKIVCTDHVTVHTRDKHAILYLITLCTAQFLVFSYLRNEHCICAFLPSAMFVNSYYCSSIGRRFRTVRMLVTPTSKKKVASTPSLSLVAILLSTLYCFILWDETHKIFNGFYDYFKWFNQSMEFQTLETFHNFVVLRMLPQAIRINSMHLPETPAILKSVT